MRAFCVCSPIGLWASWNQQTWPNATSIPCNAGAGAVSAVWPGTGTVLGYNLADLAITFMLVNPLVDTYFGGLPPPAAMDAGAHMGGGPLFHHADEQALRGDASVMLHALELSQMKFSAVMVSQPRLHAQRHHANLA